MKKLFTFFFFLILCTVLCACPYVDHGTSKAATFTSFEENVAVISEKVQYFTQITNDSAVVDSSKYNTTYSKTYELIDDFDSDGTLFYFIDIKDFDKLAYRGNNTFNGKITARVYTKERITLCEF